MSLILLVDLDDTLLENPMEVFIPAYLQAMGQHLAEMFPPEKLVSSMLDATRSMFSNHDPAITLKDAFDTVFYPALGISEAQLQPLIDQFYRVVFPTLQKYTRQKPEAGVLINSALSRGVQIGIATNPLFPKTAILQRLQWAGLAVDLFPFALVPSYESFHFAKPDPAFFAEFLTQMGWPDDPILMVGNDPDHDIRGSALIGIRSYWISEDGSDYPNDFPEPDGRGRVENVFQWIDGQNPDDFIPRWNTPTAMIAVLKGGPAGISAMIAAIKDELWRNQPEANQWSLTEVLCHLRDVEQEVNLPRLKRMLAEKNPFIRGIDSDRWVEERDYLHQDGPRAFADFLAARKETLAILESLQEKDWEREVRHAIFGPTSLKEIISFMAGHEILHGKQTHALTRQFQSWELTKINAHDSG